MAQGSAQNKTKITDGSGNIISATANALDVNIKSGNPSTITATQGTGSNLHTVVDSGSITAVQGTGTNLHTVVDSGAVTATLNAETTKVIGVTRTADGSGNLLTSTSSALDVNVKSGELNVGTPTETTPTIANTTSVTLVAANASRKYLFIQNNSSANIMISLSGSTLTGIAPTSSNKGVVLPANSAYESSSRYVTTAAITVYQSSGSSINTVSVVEG